jgi:hypothetical protein
MLKKQIFNPFNPTFLAKNGIKRIKIGSLKKNGGRGG